MNDFIKETVVKNFLSLISLDTQSDPNSKTYPSTDSQKEFAKILANKCREIGLSDISIDKYSYVSATLFSNLNTKEKTIAFISHMDTSPDFFSKNIKPKIIKNYNGKEISLLNNVTLSPKKFSSLNKYIGKTLITTDGTTILGADDKAGISEILTALEYLKNNPDIKHHNIRVLFTPDEEIGKGVDYFNAKSFGCNFAYTIDGSGLGELSYENFNACRGVLKINGKNVHPGYAKNIMINASLLLNEFINKLPKNETPETTEKYEGFYHISNIKSSVESALIEFIIRDFDKNDFIKRKHFIKDIVNDLNLKYDGLFSLNLEDEYFNMYEILKDKKEIIDIAKNAMKKAGIEPIIKPIRGGTDGARLSFMGLPCPNIFTGAHNFHGPYEYVCVDSMVKCVEVLINIASH